MTFPRSFLLLHWSSQLGHVAVIRPLLLLSFDDVALKVPNGYLKNLDRIIFQLRNMSIISTFNFCQILLVAHSYVVLSTLLVLHYYILVLFMNVCWPKSATHNFPNDGKRRIRKPNHNPSVDDWSSKLEGLNFSAKTKFVLDYFRNSSNIQYMAYAHLFSVRFAFLDDLAIKWLSIVNLLCKLRYIS